MVSRLSTWLGCKRRSEGLEALGIPTEYAWEGLGDAEIDAYYEAKDKALDELELTEADTWLQEVELMQRVPAETREQLKGLLLQRAIRLVHVLKPIEEQRRGMRAMQGKGYLTQGQVSSFEQAEELCGRELKSVMEESQLLAPGLPQNSIIQAAVQAYHRINDAAAEEADGEKQPSFEDMKRGFFKNAPPPKMAHGFVIGAEVEAHGLQTESMNGARGRVKGTKGERVAVNFPEPIGEKALRPVNLRLVPDSYPVHPDATDVPMTQFQVCLHHSKGQPLGIKFTPEPPPEQQKADQQSWLLVTGFHENGQAAKHNAAHKDKDPAACLQEGDRLVAVVDASVDEKQQKPVGGNSRAILSVMASGKSPLVFIVQRILGPPLRYKVGQFVKANCGNKGWLAGQVIKVWEDGNQGPGSKVPYVIRIEGAGNVVCAPMDSDNFIMKGNPRFKIGDEVVANYQGGYKKGKITEINNARTYTSYGIQLTEGEKPATCNAPEDLNRFVRPLARYEKGTKVLANVANEFVPGVIEAVYHPNWVYAVRLDAGNVVFVPEDIDHFMKKAE